ncbi:MAG: hypothetical protein IPN09_02155 [Bacteroidetes bacterium]|nr:hypothetical protein [Bacteroidota bacterium]
MALITTLVFYFGDGAAAILVERATENDLYFLNKTKTVCVTDNIDDITYYSSLSKDFDERIQLSGSKVYRNGTSLTIDFTKQYLSENNLSITDFDYFIFHQSNFRMLNEISSSLKIPSKKMLINLDKVGNTASASIPLCLAQFKDKNTFKKGDRILLCSFGAGYSLAIADFNWST